MAVSLSSQNNGSDRVPFVISPDMTFCKPLICTVHSRIRGDVISSGGKLHIITTTPIILYNRRIINRIEE